MAGEWLKFEANTPEKPEVFAITAALGWDDPDLTVGKLLKVWRWFDQHTINGNANNVTLALLDRISGVSGFAKAMLDVGWIVQIEQGFMLPHFDRHNGKTAKDRALTAKRVAKHKSNDEGNDGGVTSPLPREEKSREDIPSNSNELHVIGGADDQEPVGEHTPECPCPHKSIIHLYHEILPSNPRIKDWGASRAKHLRTRWNEQEERQNLDFWRRFFEYVASCDFLTGKTPNPFLPNLEWLVTYRNFVRIIEGNYENKK